MSAPSTSLQRRIVALLLLGYVLNFLDRQIVAILKIPIKADLQLTDTQLGLMGGLAFALLYSTLAIPIARYADRHNARSRVIAVAIAVWSGFTALCAAVTGFWTLFLARMGVGIGEAGGVAPSYALIADTVPANRRARSLALFSLGIPIGSALGLYFGGWLASALNWRATFVIIGLIGFPLAFAIRRYVPEAPAPPGEPQESFARVFRRLAAKPSFWLLSFGAASASICGYGLGFWLPSYFHDSLGLGLAELGVYYGTIVLIGGIAGIWLGGWVGDRLGEARPGAYAMVPGVAFLITAPLYLIAMRTESLDSAFLLFLIPYALSLAWLGPVVAAIQLLVPPAERATASSAMLLINNLIGIGLGTSLFGWLADYLRPLFGEEAMRTAIELGLGCYLVAALLMILAAFRIAQDRAD